MANKTHPAEFLLENLEIQNNVISQSFLNKVKKFCFLGSSCIYPCKAQQPIKEEYLLTGPLEPTNEGYALAKIAGIDIQEFATEMFHAGSNLRDKSAEEIFYQDFKRFTAGKTMIGVGQITSLNAGELRTLKERMAAFMRGAAERNGLDMVFFMLTNILTETTELVCQGQGALQLAAKAFHLDVEDDQNPVLTLPGVVSRKKQLIPELMLAEQE